MRQRLPLWFLALALLTALAIWLWKTGDASQKHQIQTNGSVSKASPLAAAQTSATAMLSQPTPVNFTETLARAHEKQNRSHFPNRLSNTTLTLKQLVARDSAILLQNALLDTAAGVSLNIPGHLQASDDPRTYIVQAKGPPDEAFRAQLKQAGATIVSYIPNNAYLVRAEAGAAQSLEQLPQTQSCSQV